MALIFSIIGLILYLLTSSIQPHLCECHFHYTGVFVIENSSFDVKAFKGLLILKEIYLVP